jgi:catechol 2,3-dioxygenase-like lactoylglutathione lyase family enzyme
MSRLHHVEIWVPDLTAARPRWDWLFGALGWAPFQDWPGGRSWRGADGAYVVLEESPALHRDVPYDRMRAGLNHLAVAVPERSIVDSVAAEGPGRGWELLFADRHPQAGGAGTYAAYLADADGFEVEVVGPADASSQP